MMAFVRGENARRSSSGSKCQSGRVQRDHFALGSAKQRIGVVALVEGLEDDHFIARIGGRQQRCRHALGRPAGDGNLAFGIEFEPVGPQVLGCDGIPERLRAPRDRVLIVIGFDGLNCRLFEIDRGGEIGETLGEVHRAMTDRKPRHFADHGFGELRGAVALESLAIVRAKPSQAGSRFLLAW